MGQCSANPCLDGSLRDEHSNEVLNIFEVPNSEQSISPNDSNPRLGGSPLPADIHLASAPLSDELVDRATVHLDSGIKYTGHWRGSIREGYGILEKPEGSKYTGSFLNDKAHGDGTFSHPSGDVYEGQWVNDRAHGFGKFTHSGGAHYEGQWEDDLQNGFGREKWSDGSTFSGHYKGSKKNGHGTFTWAEGATYEGDFQNNEIHGQGSYKWTDGRVYTGQWEHNHMHGLGRLEWADGRVYEGQYVQDKKDGMGKYTWPEGRIFVGKWKDGKQHGQGVYTNSKGVERRGEWCEGRRIKWLDTSGPDNINEASCSTSSDPNPQTKICSFTSEDRLASPATPGNAHKTSGQEANKSLESSPGLNHDVPHEDGPNISNLPVGPPADPAKKLTFFRRMFGGGRKRT